MAGGRPPLPIGSHGSIATGEVRPGVFRAHTRFRDQDGVTRKVSATGRTVAHAERELKQKLADRATASEGLITSTMRLRRVAEIWLDLIEKEGAREASSIIEYRRAVKNMICHPSTGIGDLRLREANAGRLDRFIQAQATPAAKKRAKTLLSMMMDAAVRDGALASNPVRSTRAVKSARKDVHVLDIDDLESVRRGVWIWMTKKRPGPRPSQDVPDVVDLMLATGCRIGEALAIRWSDVDLAADRPTVTIAGTIKTLKGQGTFRKPTPKNDASYRIVTLPQFAVDMLLRRQVEQSANKNDAVFSTRNGTWHQVGNMEKRWRSIRREVGLKDVTPHMFRKTVATLIDRLVDAEAAARLLGHSSSATTKQFYIERDRHAPDVSAIIQSFAAPRRHST